MVKHTDNQDKFIQDAEGQGFEVYQYSGRGMFGDECPAITVDDPQDFKTDARYYTDNMGLSFVLYARG